MAACAQHFEDIEAVEKMTDEELREHFRHKYRPDPAPEFDSWQDEAADSAGVPRFGEI